MEDWYKVYNVSEESGASASDNPLITCNKIKSWIDEKFSDILECEVTNLPTSTSEGTASQACVNIYPKGLNKILGFFYHQKIYNSSSSPACYVIGLKTSRTGSSISIGSTAVDSDLATEKLSQMITSLKLKVIRLKQCYIVDFYMNGYKKKCRLMVSDVHGEKVATLFYNSAFYCNFANSTSYKNYGNFLLSQSLEKKNLFKFVFPWTDTWVEGFYETDNIVDDNKPYVFNNKTYIDICGNNGYRGLAIEAIKGDNDLLYVKETEETTEETVIDSEE
jgi:hypothetical protein